MTWPNSLSRRPPGTSADDGKDNIPPSPPKAPSNTDEKPIDHDAPSSSPIPPNPSDPDGRFSSVSATTPNPSTDPDPDPLPPSKPLNEEDLLALTSEPLSHGGAWSSPPPANQNPSSNKPQDPEEVYTGNGKRKQKSTCELAREKLRMRAKKIKNDARKSGKKHSEAQGDGMRSGER
ncbi:hypothetical protein DSL72_009309 [Monilinia vaccinii-corymbosi]|uniref:Uncharacterized protein n=1 Tax=Monilinia vaccinii-corymbosi TaxID=61207 RepID=A0A8A3PQR5_9HELO|nr:hypothetical protein DSL72_009309 [Monilinia vaccinii-corymbosi]